MKYNITRVALETQNMTAAELLRYAAEIVDSKAPNAYAVAVCNRALTKLKGTP